MGSREMSIKQFAAYQHRLAETFWDELAKGARIAGMRAQRHMVQVTSAAKPAPVNTGQFRRAWKSDVLRASHSVMLEVYNPTPYAPIIEYGRRPGKRPPRQAIEQWVERKFGVKNEADKRAIAFVVARKIGQRGIEGKHLLEGAIPDLEKMIIDEIKQHLDRVIARGG